jgi:hypothetical protein
MTTMTAYSITNKPSSERVTTNAVGLREINRDDNSIVGYSLLSPSLDVGELDNQFNRYSTQDFEKLAKAILAQAAAIVTALDNVRVPPADTSLTLHNVDEDKLRIRRRLNHLKTLQDGWADGMQIASKWGHGFGKAPPTDGLDWLAVQLEIYYSSDLPRPYLYPTPEGGVQIEWSIGVFSASLEIDLSTQHGQWFCTDVRTTDIDDFSEREVNLNDASTWQWIASELRHLREQTP